MVISSISGVILAKLNSIKFLRRWGASEEPLQETLGTLKTPLRKPAKLPQTTARRGERAAT